MGLVLGLFGVPPENQEMNPEEAQIVTEERLQAIEKRLDVVADLLRNLATIKPLENRSSFSVEEVAQLVGRSPYQIRAWCRDARISAERTREGRGASKVWRIPAEALQEYRDCGLRPPAGG